MRRSEFSMARTAALSFLRRAEFIHLASTNAAGEPVLRTLNAVVVDDWLLFHGAKAGEKTLCLGRPAVATAEVSLASIPSYFVDPERACPATTFYESVQVHASIEAIDEPALKARMLSALMEKYQPEGGYTPIRNEDPLYQGAVRGVLVFGLRLANVSGKSKVGQNRSEAERLAIAEGLWARGRPGDARTIQRMFEENPGSPRPERFTGVDGALLEPALDERSVSAAVTLVADEYWNRRYDRERLARAHLQSSAWLGARTPDGTLVATARALSDGAKQAIIADVAVERSWRGKGLGRRLIALLLEHPAVRSTHIVRLGTADAQSFYEKLGFVEGGNVDLGFQSTPMTLRRELRPGALNS
jgi:nitroimidazol reductase NimA-like FMN-containing flavoprotein (pyridoxamine 5'-phosphate oxidase superfamily)/GNAT superfamily N-acetyltransferase